MCRCRGSPRKISAHTPPAPCRARFFRQFRAGAARAARHYDEGSGADRWRAIGKPKLGYMQVPFMMLEPALVQMGMPKKTAALLIEMWKARMRGSACAAGAALGEEHDADDARNIRHRSFRASIFRHGGEGVTSRLCESLDWAIHEIDMPVLNDSASPVVFCSPSALVSLHPCPTCSSPAARSF